MVKKSKLNKWAKKILKVRVYNKQWNDYINHKKTYKRTGKKFKTSPVELTGAKVTFNKEPTYAFASEERTTKRGRTVRSGFQLQNFNFDFKDPEKNYASVLKKLKKIYDKEVAKNEKLKARGAKAQATYDNSENTRWRAVNKATKNYHIKNKRKLSDELFKDRLRRVRYVKEMFKPGYSLATDKELVATFVTAKMMPLLLKYPKLQFATIINFEAHNGIHHPMWLKHVRPSGPVRNLDDDGGVTEAVFDRINEKLSEHPQYEGRGDSDIPNRSHRDISSLEILAYVPIDEGKCNTKRDHYSLHMLRDDENNLYGWRLGSYLSTKNVCGLMCIRKHLGIKSSTRPKGDFNRIFAGTSKTYGEAIALDDFGLICDYYDCGVVIKDAHGFVLKEVKHEDEKRVVPICLKEDHYYHITRVVRGAHCIACGRWYADIKKHKAGDGCSPGYHQRQVLKKKGVRPCPKPKEKADDSNKLYWDLETFTPEGERDHVAYANGYRIGSGKFYKDYIYIEDNQTHFLREVYDPETKQLESTREWVEDGVKSVMSGMFELIEAWEEDNPKKGLVMVAHNGACFDSYFLINELHRHGYLIHKRILTSGKLLILDWSRTPESKHHKIWDSYQFINSPLAKALKDFKVSKDLQKGEFDHRKMTSWQAVREHRDEAMAYLQNDVLGIQVMVKMFADAMWEVTQMNIFDSCTISSMAYRYWTTTAKKWHIELTNEKKHAFIQEAVYGGRTYPTQRYYRSELYDRVISGNATHEEVKRSRKYVFDGDIKSLYPTTYQRKFPVGESYWCLSQSEIVKLILGEWDQKKNPTANDIRKWMRSNKVRTITKIRKRILAGDIPPFGVYEVSFTAPKNIMHSMSPHRENGALLWDLTDGRRIYTGVDIKNMVRVGYQITDVHKGIIWDDGDNTMLDFVMKIYRLKGEQDVLKGEGSPDYNPALRTACKLFLNALFGKMLQRPIHEVGQYVYDDADMDKFMSKNSIVGFTPFEDRYWVVGEPLDQQTRDDNVVKPNYMGAYILAYSREIMLDKFLQIDPTLQDPIMFYGDTDSLMFDAKHLSKVPTGEELGDLSNDIDDDGLIIEGVWFAPKKYFQTYINNKGEIKTVVKLAGVPHKELYEVDDFGKATKTAREDILDMYRKAKDDPTKSTLFAFESLKKDSKNFRIMNKQLTRTFNKTAWQGRVWRGNVSYPHGHEALS